MQNIILFGIGVCFGICIAMVWIQMKAGFHMPTEHVIVFWIDHDKSGKPTRTKVQFFNNLKEVYQLLRKKEIIE